MNTTNIRPPGRIKVSYTTLLIGKANKENFTCPVPRCDVLLMKYSKLSTTLQPLFCSSLFSYLRNETAAKPSVVHQMPFSNHLPNPNYLFSKSLLCIQLHAPYIAITILWLATLDNNSSPK